MDDESKRETRLAGSGDAGSGTTVDQSAEQHINGAVKPDRFPSDDFPNWVQWKIHFVAVAEANRRTKLQTINAIAVCIRLAIHNSVMAFRKLGFVWPLPIYATTVRLDYIGCFYDGYPISATVYHRNVYRLEEITIPPSPGHGSGTSFTKFCESGWEPNSKPKFGSLHVGIPTTSSERRLKINRTGTVGKVLNTLELGRIGFLDPDFHFSSAIFGL